ncbi:hypothetical protein LDENG_00113080, partial [Lucifuga dentata]
MEITNRVRDLFHYLQDPHLVARFQHICGVRGTFSTTVSAGNCNTSSDKKEDQDRSSSPASHACHRLSSGENESENYAVRGGGEGRKEEMTPPEVRRRTVGSSSGENPHQNGTLVTSAATRGEAAVVGSNGRSLAGDSTAGQSDHSVGFAMHSLGDTEETEDLASRKSSTVKPLRKNSLTGDVGQEFLIENRFLHYLFTFGTELGNEFFYITFFPFLIWNIDAFVGRRLIMVWVWVMYLGQCTKDVMGWSRPASPPVVKVEMFYNSEYSMPSTHAMSGTAIPLFLFMMTYGRWEYPFSVGFSLALCWCLLVCVSRIYMGMHSILDVMAGVLYSILILLVFLPALDLIDDFNLSCRYAPLIIISLHLALGLFSFTLDTWSTSRSNTAQILGTGAGVALASHVNYYLGLMPDPAPDQLPFSVPPLSVGLVGMAVLRLVLG